MSSTMLLLALFLVASSSAQESSPLRLPSVVINGAGDNSGPRSCPSAEVLESARRNISADIVLSLGFSLPACGDGDWIQVANFNMIDESQQCLSLWVEQASPARSCAASVGTTCQGVTFPVPAGVTYNRVCGRATGYSIGTTDAFADLFDVANGNIDMPYLEGVSVTHGSPRQHIWSFAGGYGPPVIRCPCDTTNRNQAPLPPSFVGDNWFCDGDYNGALWDGRDCTTDCCTFNSPPWFSASLPTSTSDDIEVRICSDEGLSNERVQLSMIELFVSQ